MKRLLTVLVAALLLLNILPAGAEEIAEMDRRMDILMRMYDTVGAAVLVAKDGQIVYQHNYGYEDRGSRTRVTNDTHFRVASVTKMISALRVMQLVEAGKLSLDTDISEYLGYPVQNPYTGGYITLRMLMSHTSSLAGGNYRFPDRGVRRLIGDTRKQNTRFLKQAPGEAYVYSNFGAGLMGTLIELAEGINADTSVKNGVFAPLNIDAGYAIQTLSADAKVASIYSEGGVDLKRGRKQWAATQWDAGCDPETHYGITVGDLLITPRDLCRLGMMLEAGGTLEGVQLLSAETVQLMMADQKGSAGISADSPYGLCVHRDTRLLPGHTLYGHQGHLEGSLCSLYWEPETHMVVLLVSNGCRMAMDKGTAKFAERVWRLAWELYGE